MEETCEHENYDDCLILFPLQIQFSRSTTGWLKCAGAPTSINQNSLRV